MTIRTTKEQEIKHNFIAGEWRPGIEYMKNINPSDTDDVIARYAIASGNDVQDAVSAAVTAVPVWSSSTSGERFEILDAIGSEIIQRKDELGDLLAREEGKTLKEAVAELIVRVVSLSFLQQRYIAQSPRVIALFAKVYPLRFVANQLALLLQ